MDSRKQQLLELVVETYIQTAEPVGSVMLSGKNGLEVSGATIRNEMRALEDEGYLTHPHTSAGRIPTEKGYEFYVENFALPGKLAKSVEQEITRAFSSVEEKTVQLKEVGKIIAEKSENAAIIAFNESSLYYTGISYLFSQMEFRNFAEMIEISTIFDQCEERIVKIDEMIGSDVKIFIGKNNPLGNACSTVATRLPGGALFLLLGPMRMDYRQNVGMVNYLKSIFE